jgi:hypothetical protein
MREGDPPLSDEIAAVPVASAYDGAAEQARCYLAFLATLEAGGLSRGEALWLTAQVWRAT